MENKIQEEFEWKEYKVCITCKTNYPIAMFHWKYKQRGIRQPICNKCRKITGAEWYQKNIEKVCVESKSRRERNQNFVLQHILKNPCKECGETDPLVLEFDHRDRKTKSFNISDGCVRKYALDRMREEVAKCDVLCANCHNRKTAKESRYFVYRVLHEGYEYIPWKPHPRTKKGR